MLEIKKHLKRIYDYYFYFLRVQKQLDKNINNKLVKIGV